jgi:hypothetical protein
MWSLHREDGVSKVLRNVGILSHHYTASCMTQWRWRQQGPPKRWCPTTSLHGVTTQWRWRQQGPPKRRCPTTSLHGVTTHKTTTWIFIAVKAPGLAAGKMYSVLWTWNVIIVYAKAHNWSLSWARWIQFLPLHRISLRSILILWSHLRLGNVRLGKGRGVPML